MIRTAEVGNNFFTKAEKNSKKSEGVINDFLEKFDKRVLEFGSNFNRMTEEARDKILTTITQANDEK